ncbi:MAG: hypothetical protein FWG67_00865 [Defluviitaleaceae bacterium]|nr:hypothetical protein [Defluviitaleaceae bacterium]
MDYFVLGTDKRIVNVPNMTFPKQIETAKHLDLNPYLGKALMVMVKSDPLNEYPDYMEVPLNLQVPMMLISHKLKKIVSQYQPNIDFQMALLIERERAHQDMYHLMNVPEIDALADDISFDNSGYARTLVLDEKKIGATRIFRIKGHNKKLIVRLDVAESLLRRDGAGMTFEKVKMKEEEKTCLA